MGHQDSWLINDIHLAIGLEDHSLNNLHKWLKSSSRLTVASRCMAGLWSQAASSVDDHRDVSSFLGYSCGIMVTAILRIGYTMKHETRWVDLVQLWGSWSYATWFSCRGGGNGKRSSLHSKAKVLSWLIMLDPILWDDEIMFVVSQCKAIFFAVSGCIIVIYLSMFHSNI